MGHVDPWRVSDGIHGDFEPIGVLGKGLPAASSLRGGTYFRFRVLASTASRSTSPVSNWHPAAALELRESSLEMRIFRPFESIAITLISAHRPVQFLHRYELAARPRHGATRGCGLEALSVPPRHQRPQANRAPPSAGPSLPSTEPRRPSELSPAPAQRRCAPSVGRPLGAVQPDRRRSRERSTFGASGRQTDPRACCPSRAPWGCCRGG